MTYSVSETGMLTGIVFVLGAYLLGSLPHLSALSKLCGIEIEGDSHIGLWRGGRLVGTVGLLGDFAKGIIPIVAGKSLEFDLATVVVAGLAAVCGQMWPVFSRFNGEKGNTIGLGMAGALTTKAMFIALVPIAVGAAVRTLPRLLDAKQTLDERLKFGGPPSRSLPLGMAIGFLALPVVSLGLGEPREITLGYTALFALIMLRRLTAGLKGDLVMNSGLRAILKNRFLYDRPAQVLRIKNERAND